MELVPDSENDSEWKESDIDDSRIIPTQATAKMLKKCFKKLVRYFFVSKS